MVADPAFDGDADSADFLVADPNSGFARYTFPVKIIVSKEVDHDFFKIAQKAMQVALSLLQVDDRIDYLLTRTVKCNVTAAFCFADLHVSLSEDFFRRKDIVVASVASAASDRDRWRVLDKDEGVRDPAVDALVDKL